MIRLLGLLGLAHRLARRDRQPLVYHEVLLSPVEGGWVLWITFHGQNPPNQLTYSGMAMRRVCHTLTEHGLRAVYVTAGVNPAAGLGLF